MTERQEDTNKEIVKDRNTDEHKEGRRKQRERKTTGENDRKRKDKKTKNGTKDKK